MNIPRQEVMFFTVELTWTDWQENKETNAPIFQTLFSGSLEFEFEFEVPQQQVEESSTIESVGMIWKCPGAWQ